MKPKEKANRLFLKYHNLWINGNSILAKQCALIAVDEILDSHYKLLLGVNTNTYKYWQEVKEEILKL
jgi:hypothetical protein